MNAGSRPARLRPRWSQPQSAMMVTTAALYLLAYLLVIAFVLALVVFS